MNQRRRRHARQRPHCRVMASFHEKRAEDRWMRTQWNKWDRLARKGQCCGRRPSMRAIQIGRGNLGFE